MDLAPLTGFFGPNSSGKTSLLQFLLLMKQTVRHADRRVPLFLGDPYSAVDLGTFEDVVFSHDDEKPLSWEIGWELFESLKIGVRYKHEKGWMDIKIKEEQLTFQATLQKRKKTSSKASIGDILVREMAYALPDRGITVGMRYEESAEKADRSYRLFSKPSRDFRFVRNRGRAHALPPPVKFYGFPDEVRAYYQNAGWLFDLQVEFEKLWNHVFYLGPLREYPQRQYIWSGVAPEDVGTRGERCVEALLASRGKGRYISRGPGRGKRKMTLEESVAHGLKEMGLVHGFKIIPLREDDKLFRVEVQIHKNGPWCNLTDVGFGVSQVLPVITLLYYVPERSVVILEQPEIHLHPSAQSALADVLIDAIQYRHIQIILESHSEYLLKRLQRRIAEERISSQDVALYFISMERGKSSLTPLEVDHFGRILNWPKNFFGDELGEMMEMEKAIVERVRRQSEELAKER